MGSLIEHAKTELQKAGLFDKSGDFYGGMTGKAVLELIECFEKQGHSGMSAPMVVSIFQKVANFKPISPIECTEDEWSDVSEWSDTILFQNKRLGSVFKEGKDGKPYYLDAIAWVDKDGGAFTGEVEGITSRQYIKLPFEPKTFYVLIDSDRKIIDHKTLKEAFEYYDKFHHTR